MTSRFTWLDHSEAERKQALDAIELFRQRETVDELGLAGVRDVFADLLMPATSTIQSRARYFLFVPWIYQELERKGVGADVVRQRARKSEVVLMKALLAAEDPEDLDGVFGREAGEKIKRLPSSVYWNGLAMLGIRLFRGSLERYHSTFGQEIVEEEACAPSEVLDEKAALGNWDAHLPKAPAGFPETAKIRLRRVDAEYLLDRLRLRATGSLFHLLAEEDWDDDEAEFPWEHPVAARLDARMSPVLEHARCFAEVMHGAALLYNRMLARKVPNEELSTQYEADLEAWVADIERRREALQRWDRASFWSMVVLENPRAAAAARTFAERWCSLVLGARSGKAVLGATGEALVEAREVALKGDRARLRSKAHLEQWRGASGVGRMNYRWSIGRSLAWEIREGLSS